MPAGLGAPSSGSRSSHMSEPTQLLIGRLAGSEGGCRTQRFSCQTCRSVPVLSSSTPGGGVEIQQPPPVRGVEVASQQLVTVTVIEIGVFPCTPRPTADSLFPASLGWALVQQRLLLPE